MILELRDVDFYRKTDKEATPKTIHLAAHDCIIYNRNLPYICWESPSSKKFKNGILESQDSIRTWVSNQDLNISNERIVCGFNTSRMTSNSGYLNRAGAIGIINKTEHIDSIGERNLNERMKYIYNTIQIKQTTVYTSIHSKVYSDKKNGPKTLKVQNEYTFRSNVKCSLLGFLLDAIDKSSTREKPRLQGIRY